MLKSGALRDSCLPRVRVTGKERVIVEARVFRLGFKTMGEYIRYCINKEMEETEPSQ